MMAFQFLCVLFSKRQFVTFDAVLIVSTGEKTYEKELLTGPIFSHLEKAIFRGILTTKFIPGKKKK